MPLDLSTIDKPSEPSTFSYGWKDTVLYALGIGAKKEGELDWLYEGDPRASGEVRPKVVPSFVVVPMFQPMLDCIVKTGGDLTMVVHGAQRVRLHGPIPPKGTLTTVARTRGIYDLRRFAIVIVDTEIKDAETGKLIADTSSQIIIRDAGGFGGTTPPKEPKVAEIPKDRKEPDFRIEEKTTPEQALLYRLSGDINPLHADRALAAKVGFEQGPILHGLCTFGHMVRHAAQGACGGDVSRLTGFEASFKKPVWPGDTLATEGWILGGEHAGKVALLVKVKERADEIVCGNAWATFAS